jgi:hypothetical protein
MQAPPIASGSREKANMFNRSLMMIAATLMLGFAAAADRQDRRADVWFRAMELAPQRRDEPLRYLNISDNEVREIQLVAEKYLPRVLLNISPVVTGCPCEEGPQCTDQVYIVAETPQSSKGLQLSRVKNAWVVGNVQQWYLRYDELRSRREKMEFLNFMREQSELFREFPSCVGELVPAEDNTASAQKVESRK